MYTPSHTVFFGAASWLAVTRRDTPANAPANGEEAREADERVQDRVWRIMMFEIILSRDPFEKAAVVPSPQTRGFVAA